jgi:beta-aspartyl-peptidase (threonine type)
MYALVVHGGAGSWEDVDLDAALAGVRRAAEAGRALLAAGGSALDAVVAAALVLEDDPVFNAGTGATLNLRGEAECDAAVMTGAGYRAGAVAALCNVANPVLVARKVLEETDHVLIAGEGAEALARAWGLAHGNPPTDARRTRWQRAVESLGLKAPPSAIPAKKIAALVKAHPELAAARRGTIGAVAVDREGHTAVAASTGGVLLKLPGRIGDTPIPGAGTYACPAGAVAATGQGELMMRSLTTKVACDLMAGGLDAQSALRAALDRTARETGDDVGLIGVDASGRVGVAHHPPFMPHAIAVDDDPITARTSANPEKR